MTPTLASDARAVRELAKRLRELAELASPGPMIALATQNLHIANVSGPHNNVSEDMLAWDADLYVELVNNLPAILSALEGREAAIRECAKWCTENAAHTRNLAHEAMQRDHRETENAMRIQANTLESAATAILALLPPAEVGK